MDYVLLETFIVVCDTLNLTKASELLYRTQPTITSRIKMLEDYLGFSLIIRNKGKRSIELTSKGEAFLTIAKQLMKLYDEIEKVQKNVSNHLAIASIDSIGPTVISEVCKEFLESNLTASIKTYQTREAYELIRKREIDIAFVSEDLDVQNVTCEPIFKQNYYVIKPCKNPTNIKKIHPSQLDIKDEIYQRWGKEFEEWHSLWWGSRQKPKVEVDSSALLAQFFISSNDWSIMQAGNLKWLSKLLSFQVYSLECPPPPRICYMITNSYPDKKIIPMIKKFRTVLHEFINRNDSYILPIED